MFEFLQASPWSRRRADDAPVLSHADWLQRRRLVQSMGYAGVLAGLGGPAFGREAQDSAREEALKRGFAYDTYTPSERWVPSWEGAGGAALYPAKRNDVYDAGRALTPEDAAAKHNNFYEFLPGKAGPVYKYVDDFEVRPWEVKITGEVEQERTVDLDDIGKIAPLEERIYRFRCVERWSMVVPWIGLPLAQFVRFCKPKPSAKYIKFTSFLRPKQAPGQRKAKHYPWPYYEGLRIDEALHPLALLATGIYGHALPTQHGAPLRLIVPWKYGYKSAKSFVEVEFTSEQPGTFWSDLQPAEYPFLSNVDPRKPHPRWSQATEWDVATRNKMPTRLYNGYDEAAVLYRD